MGAQPPSPAGPVAVSDVDLAWAVLESSPLPAVATDLAGQITYANAAAREIWDLQEALSTGLPSHRMSWFIEGIHPADDPLSAALAGSPLSGEPRRLWLASGEPWEARVHSRILTSSAGEPIGAMMSCFLRDASIVAQERLQDYASDLELLGEVSRMLSEVRDLDEATAMIATVALGATGAMKIMLWRHAQDGLEVVHEEAMLELPEFAELGPRLREAAQGALSAASPEVEVLEAAGATCTVWHEPLVSAGTGVGVLSLIWGGELEDPERPRILISSLAHHSATALERADLHARLAAAASTDPLTGVANRRTWNERLEHERLAAQRSDEPMSLLLIDIDHFKRYNDSFGHPEGDCLLREAAAAWGERLRRTDLLARIGGEEFGVLLPGCDIADARRVADALRERMPRGQTCSIGTITDSGNTPVGDLYAAADAALYRAKTGGRNRVETGQLTPTVASPTSLQAPTAEAV